jgi:hypothetical protein
VATWQEFETAAPELAAGGRRLLFQYGPGLGYLATVRPDGGPRIHPFCPIIGEGRLWALVVPSPKRLDLLRNGHYALHSFASAGSDDEFYLTGKAAPVDDHGVRTAVEAAYAATGGRSSPEEALFHLEIDRALLATYGEGNPWPPRYEKWAAPGAYAP